MSDKPCHSGTLLRRSACFVILALAVPAGLVWRLAPLHLPQFAFKYGGSALWAAAVYWTVACLLPRRQPALLATISALVATALDGFKRVQSPALDTFRDTLTGKLLLGRHFTFGAIAAYWLAIATAAACDTFFQPGRNRRSASEPWSP